MEKNIIFLTGFMGAGKSASGKRAAALLQYGFADTDKMVEASFSKSIPNIFKESGEEFFRQAERKAIEDVAINKSCIVSTGGGAPTYGDNLQFMKNAGTVITLLASPETIYQRISISETERPLLKCANPKERIESLLQKRAYYYINADFLIDTDNKSLAEVAEEIEAIVRCNKMKYRY